MGLFERLVSLRPQLAAAAQEVYDSWDQSGEDEMDPTFGGGGICDAVSEAMGNVIASQIGDVEFVDGVNEGGGDHSWLVLYDSESACEVDIPAQVYETGSGYNWKKRPGVVFQPENVFVGKLNRRDVVGSKKPLDNLRRECDHAEKPGGWCGRCEGRPPKKSEADAAQPGKPKEPSLTDSASHVGDIDPADPVPCVEHGTECVMMGNQHIPQGQPKDREDEMAEPLHMDKQLQDYGRAASREVTALDPGNEEEAASWAADWLRAEIMAGRVPSDKAEAAGPLREKLAELMPSEHPAERWEAFDGENDPELSAVSDSMESLAQRVLKDVFEDGHLAHAGLRTKEWMEAHADAYDGEEPIREFHKNKKPKQNPPACSGEEQRTMLNALIPLLSEDEVGQVLDLYNANLQITGNELAPIGKSLIEAHGLANLIPKGADERWFEYTGIGIVRDWESKNKGAKDMADKKRINQTPSAPSDTDIWDIKTIDPRDRQRKLDQLLDQYSAEQDPARKEQIEEQMRSLRASLRRTAEDTMANLVEKLKDHILQLLIGAPMTEQALNEALGTGQPLLGPYQRAYRLAFKSMRDSGEIVAGKNGEWEVASGYAYRPGQKATDKGAEDDALLEKLNEPMPPGAQTHKSRPGNMGPDDVLSIPSAEIQRRKDQLMDEFNEGSMATDEFEARMEQLRSMGAARPDEDLYNDWSSSDQGQEDMEAAFTLPLAQRANFVMACLRDYAYAGGISGEDLHAMREDLLAMVQERMRNS